MKTGLKLTLTASLLAGASLAALATDARAADGAEAAAPAAEVIFGSESLKGTQIERGRTIVLTGGVTQVRLEGGAIASFVGAAEFSVRDASAIDLRSGTVTLASPGGAPVTVHMPEGVEGRLAGAGSSASFTAAPDGARGHVMSGNATIVARDGTRSFDGGRFWRAGAHGAPSRIANADAPAPTPLLADGSVASEAAVAADGGAVPDLAVGGPAAIAEAGLPVALGEALAANGASGDVVAAARAVEASVANPSLASFPAGDYGALVAYAAQLSAPYGGSAFPGAGADIVRTYFAYLAGGGAREQFLQAYAGLLVQYLDLIRSGAAPGSFQGASVQQINDFLAYRARTGGFADLSGPNRALLDAYRAFLAGGGNPALFTRTYTDLVNAYFDYLRAGGSPAAFTGASQATVDAYLAFLRDAGLTGQLTAENRALLDAYFANGGGLAFADQYRAALGAYYDYLRAGNLPSGYSGATAAQLRGYLDTLEAAGLLSGVLGTQAGFFQAYLDHLQAGGALDAWAGLPANVFAGYASALSAFDAYLASGNLPSAYAGVPVATLRAYLEALASAGALGRYLGADAGFFEAYLAHLRAGGAADAWAGLPANVFAGYADALSAYAAHLAAGNLPSAYAGVPAATLREYLEALDAAGVLDRYLAASAGFFDAYLDYLRGGGTADGYAGLPANVFAGYAAQLEAYYAFLANGGLPSAYTALTQAQIAAYVEALRGAGALDRFAGQLAAFYSAYRDYLAGGGNPDLYAGLPTPPDFPAYAAAAQAYADFLRAGGLPSAYTALDAATLQRYLQALDQAGLLGDALLDSYLEHLRTGGLPNGFAGLPLYAGYASALEAYHAYLAGGGLPSAYGALTPAQIADYLEALSGAGVLDDLLAGQSAFLSAYLAFVQGGGIPDRFASLPVFGTYTSALQAYLAYIEQGGLPSAYGALSGAQVLAYLTALRDAGLLDALVAGAPDAAAYAAHLLAGGVPDRFAGLPVLDSYAAAVQAFFAYIAGGGRPSQYGAATQEQIVDYINALDDAGVLAPEASPEDRQQILAYADWVEAGSNPDQWAGLPPAPNPDYNYAGGFTPSSTHSWRAIAGAGGGIANLSNRSNGNQLASNAQGQVTQLGFNTRTSTGANPTQVTDVAGNAKIVVGRWTGGYTVAGTAVTTTGSESLHYYAAAPASFTLPALGRIDYTILAATRPTFLSGHGDPGTFSGAFAIDLTSRRVGIDGTIQMREGGNTVGYAFTTPGGSAAPGTAVSFQRLDDWTFNADLTGSGRACDAASCRIEFNGGFAGDAETVGFVYRTYGRQDWITGAVAFAGTYSPPVNPLPTPNYAYVPGLPSTGLRHLFDGTMVTGSSNGIRISQIRNGPAVFDANGGVTSITIDGSQPAGITLARDAATQTDVAGNASIVVGRWTEGQYRPTGGGGFPTTLSLATSVHYVLGLAPNFLVPYTGRVDYALLAATRPTFVEGGALPGLFDAAMSIAFGSQTKIGIAGSIRMPETGGVTTYGFTTAGGVAAPSANLTVAANHSFTFQAPVTGTGLACTASCAIQFNGSFMGNDPLTVGMTYATSSAQNQSVLQGAAAFTGAWVGAPQTLTRVADRPFFASALASGALNPSQGSYDVNGAGQVVGLTSFNGLYDRLGSATVAESGSLAGNLVGWSRWTNGTLDVARFGPGSVTLAPNASYQIVHGAPLSNMPASGTASYTIAGGSQSADAFGTIAPGGVATGTAKVAFGTTVKVGFDITASFNGNSYNLFTTGRTADVSTSELTVGTDGRFNAIGPGGNVTSSGTDCAGTACRPIWNGFLAGSGAAGIGLHYRVQDTVARNLEFHGTAAFTKDGAAAAAASRVSSLSAWGDWAVAGGDAMAPGVHPAAPEIGVAAPAPGAGAESSLREQANKALGGMVRF